MGTSDPVRAFVEAAEMASRVFAADEVAERWAQPSAVEGFSVGGLAGHMYAATRRLEVVLDEVPPLSFKRVGLLESYGVNRIDDASSRSSEVHAGIVEDGERRRERYGAPATRQRFQELISRLEQRLPGESLDRPVTLVRFPDGAMPLGAYLRTRVVELVVHSDDMAVSAALPALDVPRHAATVAIEVLVELARGRGDDLGIIRAFSRAERSDPDVLRVL